MGFDVDRFEGTVNDGLLCCICRDVLEDPVQAPCEHAFCSTCIAAWLVHDSICPEDRQTLLDTDLRPLFRYMKNDLDRMRLWCKNRSRGCDHMCNLEFIKRHEAECPFESVVCPNPGCGTHINRRDLREHLMQCQHMVLAATPARRSSKSTSQHELLATIDDLRTQLDLFKVDMECKLDDQKQEMDLRLDAQRRHLVQRESSLQLQIDEIRTQNCRLQQDMKQVLEMEKKHRKELEQMRAEKRELLLVLKQLQKESKETRNHRCVSCHRQEKSVSNMQQLIMSYATKVLWPNQQAGIR